LLPVESAANTRATTQPGHVPRRQTPRAWNESPRPRKTNQSTMTNDHRTGAPGPAQQGWRLGETANGGSQTRWMHEHVVQRCERSWDICAECPGSAHCETTRRTSARPRAAHTPVSLGVEGPSRFQRIVLASTGVRTVTSGVGQLCRGAVTQSCDAAGLPRRLPRTPCSGASEPDARFSGSSSFGRKPVR
jgi:hypothetical protein